MHKLFLKEIFQKYLRGDATNEEQKLVESYYQLFDDERSVFEALSTDEKNKLKSALQNKIYDRVLKENKKGFVIKLQNPLFIRIAATVLALLFIGSIFFISDKPAKKATIVSNVTPVHLTQNRVIFLPDGSTVILSAKSKLNYPSSFDGMKTREVFLEGQAFFDIKHTASKPFIVHTGKLKTTVIGTAFNIKAMPGDVNITVTVKRGKVKVADDHKVLGVIIPNQQITYDTKKISADMKTVENEKYLDWKEQDLLLDNLTISEVAAMLEERYKVKIIISDRSKSTQRFTASFSKNETLEKALNSICTFNDVSYDYKKDKALVIINSK
jgi:transmembrane sensor